MLLTISNAPRDYAWGSTTALAELEGRVPDGTPEAEVWFGDHPGAPAVLADGRTLDRWIADDGAAHGVDRPLPFLLKLLAAGAPLSIQAHPSKTQAEEGFARENAAGIPVADGQRNYRDDNHKPEIIVAVSDPFIALSGFRPLDETLRLLDDLGAAAEPLRARLLSGDPADALRETLGWLLSGEARAEVDALLGALAKARSTSFADELETIREVAGHYPGDPGVIVALLLNRVELRRGEALFTRAGVPHAYLDGLGVELMAASDNVLRGGLTPKHVDVAELLSVLDAEPGPAQIIEPAADGDGVRFAAGIPDFALVRVAPGDGHSSVIRPRGVAIALCTAGEATLSDGDDEVTLRPGQACLVTPTDAPLRIVGDGAEVYLAEPGAPASA